MMTWQNQKISRDWPKMMYCHYVSTFIQSANARRSSYNKVQQLQTVFLNKFENISFHKELKSLTRALYL
jgi:hypothetical protein